MTWFERRKGQKINLTLSAFMYEFKEGAGSKKILAGSNFCLEKKFDPAQKNSILLKKNWSGSKKIRGGSNFFPAGTLF